MHIIRPHNVLKPPNPRCIAGMPCGALESKRWRYAKRALTCLRRLERSSCMSTYLDMHPLTDYGPTMFGAAAQHRLGADPPYRAHVSRCRAHFGGKALCDRQDQELKQPAPARCSGAHALCDTRIVGVGPPEDIPCHLRATDLPANLLRRRDNTCNHTRPVLESSNRESHSERGPGAVTGHG